MVTILQANVCEIVHILGNLAGRRHVYTTMPFISNTFHGYTILCKRLSPYLFTFCHENGTIGAMIYWDMYTHLYSNTKRLCIVLMSCCSIWSDHCSLAQP